MNYLITFAIMAEKYPALVEEIKKLGEWAEITPTSFLVVSDEKSGVITERLQYLLGPHDSIAVISVSQPWASYCNPIVEDFLISQLGQGDDWIPHDWNEETQSRK